MVSVAVLVLFAGFAAQPDRNGGRAPTDAEIRVLIQTTWARLGELWKQEGALDEADTLQRETGKKLFDHFLENPSGELADEALQNAFTMWGNAGDADAMDAAIAHISDDSPMWAIILHNINNGYHKARRSLEERQQLLFSLEPRLTDPKSRSELLMTLGEGDVHRGRDEQARARFLQVLELEADPFYVQAARGELHEMDSLGVGQSAPAFEGETIDGRTVSMAELRGKVVVLEFWSTTCGPCRPEIEHLRRIADELGPRGVEVIGISLDRRLKDLEAFLAERKIDWPQLCDEKDFDGEIPRSYNVRGIPRSWIIDREGRIAAKDLRGDDLVAAVRECLENQS